MTTPRQHLEHAKSQVHAQITDAQIDVEQAEKQVYLSGIALSAAESTLEAAKLDLGALIAEEVELDAAIAKLARKPRSAK